MRRKADIMMVFVSLVVTLITAFTCFAGMRLFGNIDDKFKTVQSDIKEFKEDYKNLDTKFETMLTKQEHILSGVKQMDIRIKTLERSHDINNSDTDFSSKHANRVEGLVEKSSIN